MTVYIEPAPAKLNLYLHVRGKRPDGYHELQSLVVFAELGDTLWFDTDRPAGLSAEGAFSSAIFGTNLVATAVAAATAACPALVQGAFRLDKRLPVAAGIGGGSADAAAALRVLARANPQFTPLVAPSADGCYMASPLIRGLGADVLVCLIGRTGLLTGTGDRVMPQPAMPAIDIVLVNPGVKLATADVFRALDAPPFESLAEQAHLPPCGPFADVVELADRLGGTTRNDLEPAALRLVPAIGDVLSVLRSAVGCRMARMSGSGPTCFGLFDSKTAARNAAVGLSRAHPAWWVVATSLRQS